MKIYIAARFDDLERLKPLCDVFRTFGHVVISGWLHETERPDHLNSEEFLTKIGIKDISEVMMSDCFILDTTYSVGERGGRENEYGIALSAIDKLLIIVGPYRTVFHRLADHHFSSWDELLTFFSTNFNEGAITSQGMIKKALAL